MRDYSDIKIPKKFLKEVKPLQFIDSVIGITATPEDKAEGESISKDIYWIYVTDEDIDYFKYNRNTHIVFFTDQLDSLFYEMKNNGYNVSKPRIQEPVKPSPVNKKPFVVTDRPQQETKQEVEKPNNDLPWFEIGADHDVPF